MRTGLESLLVSECGVLKNTRVGVLANQASVTREYVHIADALTAAGVRITALFGPEHGARGDAQAGTRVGDCYDSRLGVPVYSLYGCRDAPDRGSLSEIDVMLIDLQDVGSRFYTFIHTMAATVEACGASDVPVWVLDRPNPVAWLRPEGPLPKQSSGSPFARFPIPVTHTLTVGELARMLVSGLGVCCELRVVEMSGWQRDVDFLDTGLPWVMPSPNIPYPGTALVYPGTCLLEGTNLSEGRGTTRPFELVGAPWINAWDLAKSLAALDLPGVVFRPAYFSPNCSKYAGESCQGVQVHVSDPRVYRPLLTGIAIVAEALRLCPESFAFAPADAGGRLFFDTLAGDECVRKNVSAGASPWEVATDWEQEVGDYRRSLEASQFILY